MLPKKMGIIQNTFSVLLGLKTWVGFHFRNDVNTLNLPRIKKGVLSWAFVNSESSDSSEKIEKLNLIYAKDYRIWNDFIVMAKGIKFIGRT